MLQFKGVIINETKNVDKYIIRGWAICTDFYWEYTMEELLSSMERTI